MIGPRRTPLIVVVVIILFDHHADYRALAQQIEVPNRVRTSSNVFQDSVDFKVRKFALFKLNSVGEKQEKNPIKYWGCENDRALPDPFNSGGGHYII